jgi:hypothetical protein
MFIEGAFQTENRASTLIIHRDVQTKFVDPTTIEFPLCGRYSPKCSLAAPNAVFSNPSGKNAEESGVDYLDLQLYGFYWYRRGGGCRLQFSSCCWAYENYSLL